MRPTCFAFKTLAQMRGKQWKVTSTDPRPLGLCVENEFGVDVIFWTFAQPEKIKPMDVAVQLSERIGRRCKLIRLDPTSPVDNLKIEAAGPIARLPEPLQVDLESYGIRWLTIER